MMAQTCISTKNFTTLLWAWQGNGSALYCKLHCWLGELALGVGLTKELLVGWKWEFPPELPAPGFRMLSSKDWVGTKWEGAWGAGATGSADKSLKKIQLITPKDKMLSSNELIVLQRSVSYTYLLNTGHVLWLLMTNHSTPPPPKISWSLVCAVLDAVCVFMLSERLMDAWGPSAP